MQGIIYKGRQVDADIEVRDGRKTRLGNGHTMWWNRPLRKKTELVVWHHQASEASAKTLFGNMTIRGVSVQFQIDGDGNITQLADAMALCGHAKGFNDVSVGIEIANFGVKPKRYETDARYDRFGPKRYAYDDKMHGQVMTFLRFHPAQIKAATRLGEVLSEVLEVPYVFPQEAGGRVIREVLEREALQFYRGHVGHFQLPRKAGIKVDPSPHLLDEMAMMASFIVE